MPKARGYRVSRTRAGRTEPGGVHGTQGGAQNPGECTELVGPQNLGGVHRTWGGAQNPEEAHGTRVGARVSWWRGQRTCPWTSC